jgi:hypothetical protein
MPKKPQKEANPTADLLRDLLILELGKAGVPQLKIRQIVGCDIHKVNRILKFIKKNKNHS